MAQGRIIRSISGFYDVDDGQKITRCRAKGSFRKKNITPLVGDEVIFAYQGMIEEVLPRRNRLIRPTVSNVDQAVIVFAAVHPEPNWLLMERFLVMVQQQGIRPVICLNKWDQVEEFGAAETVKMAQCYEQAGFRVICTCTLTGQGVDELKQELAGKISVMAGPSGVGKSSLLNAAAPGFTQETGGLSEKIQRGKNTTRCAELLALPEIGGFVADTPGFTSLKLEGILTEDLEKFYPDFAQHSRECYFQGCSHVAEPECGVLAAVKNGKIAAARYEGYCAVWKELKEEESQEIVK